jgi:hypothetical protein
VKLRFLWSVRYKNRDCDPTDGSPLCALCLHFRIISQWTALTNDTSSIGISLLRHPNIYSNTKDGVLFLFSNDLVRKKYVIYFASDDRLHTVIAPTHLMINSPLSACIPQFDQVFSIHCIKYGYSKLSQQCL